MNKARRRAVWEERSVAGGEGAEEPLLEKAGAGAEQESADKRGTITLLLHYSAYDAHLLLVAFSAGARPRGADPAHNP